MGIVTFIIIAITCFVSYRGIKQSDFFMRYVLEVDRIRFNRDYKRFFTAGFLHVDWLHLIFNMITLLFVGPDFEGAFGWYEFLLIYLVGLLGGNALAYYMRRHDGSYSVAGASGAVNGVLFALIAIVPGIRLNFFILPMPGWLFGLLFVLVSVYGIRSRAGGISHEAHIGGALLGMAVALLLHPAAIVDNYITLLIIAVPAVVLLFILLKKPHLLLLRNPFVRRKATSYTIEDKYNATKLDTQQEIDRILEKIHTKGMKSLTKEEKQLLERYSKQSS